MSSKASIDIYLASLYQYKILPREEEYELLVELQDLEKDSRPYRIIVDKLVKSNIKYVVSFARTYVSEIDLFEDLIAEGNMALLKAIDKYDPNELSSEGRPIKLITYAKWWLFQAILLYKSTHSYTVRLPVNIVHEGLRLSKELRKELQNSEDDYVDEAKLAVNAKVPVDKVQDVLGHMGAHMANQSPSELLNMEVKGSNEFYENNQDKIDQILSVLSPTQIDIIKRLNGLAPHPREYNLIEISLLYDKTSERIRQIKVEALKKLQLIYTEDELRGILF